jgi:hypothetical protein
LSTQDDIAAVLAQQASDPATSWSLGSFGAIAEFTRDAGEPAQIEAAGNTLAVSTGRGALRLAAVEGLRLFASETTTRENWNQRVSLCLPESDSAMSRRTMLTELGPDTEAIRPQDRAGILFDLGLDTLQTDACVRMPREAADALRACCGRPAFAPDSQAMHIILAANPHRVFLSRAGRAEVFQPIPPPHGKSPEGPHTHVLPKLLKLGRTHAATEAVPDGFVPCAHFYPANPVKDAMGMPHPFVPAQHEAFQALLGRFGDGELLALKRSLTAALAAGSDPSAFAVPDDRFARTAVRVALRQLAAAGRASPALAAWQAVHDPRQIEDSADDETEGNGTPPHH